MLEAASASQSSKFNLKNEFVELVPSRASEEASVSLDALEAMRTRGPAVPASKNGLEVICGASCETGAQ